MEPQVKVERQSNHDNKMILRLIVHYDELLLLPFVLVKNFRVPSSGIGRVNADLFLP